MALYIVCYDLAQPQSVQLEQISYWLNFLISSLPLPPSPESNWCIILVGLRADLQPSTQHFTLKHLVSWKKQWSRLPLHNQLFFVSSTTSKEGVKQLFDTITQECRRIFSSHAVQIPTKFRQTLDKIRSNPSSENAIFSQSELFTAYGSGIDRHMFSLMLRYFHEIGQIAVLGEELVCTSIQHIAKIAAKFVSPEDVRIHLINRSDEEGGGVQILSKENVEVLLDLPSTQQQRYVKATLKHHCLLVHV